MKLQCTCGKALNVPDSLIGQKIRCKDCGKVLTIRQSSSSDDNKLAAVDSALLIQGHRRCKGCGKSYPFEVKICIPCGMNVDTGATMYTSLDVDGDGAEASPVATAEPVPLVTRLLRMIGLGSKPGKS